MGARVATEGKGEWFFSFAVNFFFRAILRTWSRIVRIFMRSTLCQIWQLPTSFMNMVYIF
jgi:hypothetical protein